jgi:hypothetical protein
VGLLSGSVKFGVLSQRLIRCMDTYRQIDKCRSFLVELLKLSHNVESGTHVVVERQYPKVPRLITKSAGLLRVLLPGILHSAGL